MKALVSAVLIGLVILYFIDSAFKLTILDSELFIHTLIRFIVGFFVVGIWFFYEHKIKLKTLIIIIACISLSDDFMDYYRNVDSFSPQILLHSLFVLLWGALVGYLSAKYYINRQYEDL